MTPTTPRADTPVLILGTGWKAGPWAIRSVRGAGYHVIGAHADGRLSGGRSLACPAPLRHPPVERDADGFRAWLTETIRVHGVAAVLATTEDIVRVIAEREMDLAGAQFVGPTPPQYAALCDKGLLGETAARAGVDHPLTVNVDAYTDVRDLPLPAIVKTRDSGEVADNLARAVICTTVAELDDIVGRVLAAGARPIVQEMLVGPRSNCHSLAHAGGVAAFATDVVREYPRDRGITSLARSIVPPDDFRDVVERLVAAVDYRGPLSVQVIRRADGRLAVHDVNLRLPASIGITITAGLDIPALAVDDALGRPLPPLPSAPRPTVYLGVDGEWGALWDAVRGRGSETSGQVIATARGVLRGGRRVVDPNPLDPFWLPHLAVARVTGGVRRRIPAPMRRRLRARTADAG